MFCAFNPIPNHPPMTMHQTIATSRCTQVLQGSIIFVLVTEMFWHGEFLGTILTFK